MAEKIYILGFAFNKDADHVVMAHKGKLLLDGVAGVGGKVEDFDLTYQEAMARKFREQTGLYTQSTIWDHFATLHFSEDKLDCEEFIFCFRTFTDKIYECKTMVDDKIEIFELPRSDNYQGHISLTGQRLTTHTDFLIPLAQSKNMTLAEFKLQ